MTAREQLLQELSSVPDNLIAAPLNPWKFFKAEKRFSEGDAPRTSLSEPNL